MRWQADDSASIVPLHDARIFAGPSTQASPQDAEPPSLRTDKEIGRVTSAAFSPSFARVVGLGYVHRDFAESGTNVTIVWNDAPIKAVVK